MKRKEMLINVLQPEECRIAIIEDGVLEELYVERASQESYVGNIYKGRIVNIEPTIQAAFVDFGIGRNGFLHISDVDPAYYQHLEQRGERGGRADRHERGGRGDRHERSGRGDRHERSGRSDRYERLDRDKAAESAGGSLVDAVAPEFGEMPSDPHPAPTPPAAMMTSFLGPPTPPPPLPIVPPPVGFEVESTFGAGLDDELLPPSSEPPPPKTVSRPSLPPPPRVERKREEPTFSPSAFGAGIFEDEEPIPEPVDEAPSEEPQTVETTFSGDVSTEQAETLIEAPVPTPVDTAAFIPPELSSPETFDFPPPAVVPEVLEVAPPTETALTPTPMPTDPLPEVASVPTDTAPIASSASPETRRTRRTTKTGTSPSTKAGKAGKGARAETAAEAKTERAKARAKKSKTEPTQPTAETAAAPPTEAEVAPKRKRTEKSAGPRKRPKPSESASNDEEKPRLMDSAERRTSGDEEDFDPNAPNDRFFGSSGEPRAEPIPAPTIDPTASVAVEEDTVLDAPEEEFSEPTPTSPAAVEAVEDDDIFDEDPYELDDVDEGGRPSRGRSGRGEQGRGRDRDRDRGRSGRDPSRDRTRRGASGGRDRDRDGRPKPLIQDIFKRGQEVIVQVIKEGIGTKGPTLSTYVSIAGRYLVLVPWMNRIGVSRKIAGDEARLRLRDIFKELKAPPGLGFIIRTAGVDRDKRELQNDLAYLLRLWQVVVRRIRKLAGPVEIYRESDLIIRTIRDIFTNDIDAIYVDEPNAFAHASEFLQIVMPKYAERIRYFGDTEPLFHKYGIEEEIARIHQKVVPLPNGGSIVIEQTEALVAIDVNSGSFRADSNNAAETAFQINLQAAKEIARQLRLRDLGGVIVNDFIDMRDERHRREVERAMREAMSRDRARTKVLRISPFGLIEMTRQRIRPSLKRSIFIECPHCRGGGFIKTSESISIEVMRLLQLAVHRGGISEIQVRTHPDTAYYLLNRKRREIARLEEQGKLTVMIQGVAGVGPEMLDFLSYDQNGNEVKFPLLPEPARIGSASKYRREDREREAERERGRRNAYAE